MDESIAEEIRVYYEDDYDESQRIVKGLHEIELVRTREIIERHLPAGRLRILDIGGGTGVQYCVSGLGSSRLVLFIDTSLRLIVIDLV